MGTLLFVSLFYADRIEYQSTNTEIIHKDAESIATLTPTPSDTIVFLGDIMLGRHVEVLGKRYGTDYLVASTTYVTASATTVVANFESAMATPHVPTVSGGMRFSTDVSLLDVLTKLRVTHASLANNHALDYHNAGYTTTIQSLKERDIVAFGHPTKVSTSSVTYISHNDEVIAVIGIHTLFTEPSVAEIQSVLTAVSQQSDYQIAYIHWGTEYELIHSANQANLAAVLVEAGIDLIVGHHPHVTQDIALIQGVPVFYSLGNFIFDQYFSTDVKEGYSIKLELVEERVSFQLYPHTQTNRSQTRPMTTDEASVYLDALAKRSEPSLYNQIVAGNIVISR